MGGRGLSLLLGLRPDDVTRVDQSLMDPFLLSPSRDVSGPVPFAGSVPDNLKTSVGLSSSFLLAPQFQVRVELRKSNRLPLLGLALPQTSSDTPTSSDSERDPTTGLGTSCRSVPTQTTTNTHPGPRVLSPVGPDTSTDNVCLPASQHRPSGR